MTYLIPEDKIMIISPENYAEICQLPYQINFLIGYK
jgi:hypothetical protein